MTLPMPTSTPGIPRSGTTRTLSPRCRSKAAAIKLVEDAVEEVAVVKARAELEVAKVAKVTTKVAAGEKVRGSKYVIIGVIMAHVLMVTTVNFRITTLTYY